jgi:hypothetical protein
MRSIALAASLALLAACSSDLPTEPMETQAPQFAKWIDKGSYTGFSMQIDAGDGNRYYCQSRNASGLQTKERTQKDGNWQRKISGPVDITIQVQDPNAQDPWLTPLEQYDGEGRISYYEELIESPGWFTEITITGFVTVGGRRVRAECRFLTEQGVGVGELISWGDRCYNFPGNPPLSPPLLTCH